MGKAHVEVQVGMRASVPWAWGSNPLTSSLLLVNNTTPPGGVARALLRFACQTFFKKPLDKHPIVCYIIVMKETLSKTLQFTFDERQAILTALITAKVKCESDGAPEGWLEETKQAIEIWREVEDAGEFVHDEAWHNLDPFRIGDNDR